MTNDQLKHMRLKWVRHFSDDGVSILAWSFVPRHALSGILAGTQSLVKVGLAEPEFRDAYAWMRSQMLQVGIEQPSEVCTPWWCWIQFGGGYGKPTTEGSGPDCVLLELRIPIDEVLLSDFDLWHFVLNYSYAAFTECEDDAFDARLRSAGITSASCQPYPEPFHLEMELSWRNIFDLGVESDYATYSFEDKAIQGVFWNLDPSYIVGIVEPNEAPERD